MYSRATLAATQNLIASTTISQRAVMNVYSDRLHSSAESFTRFHCSFKKCKHSSVLEARGNNIPSANNKLHLDCESVSLRRFSLSLGTVCSATRGKNARRYAAQPRTDEMKISRLDFIGISELLRTFAI